MKAEEYEKLKVAQERRLTLVARLRAGDDLHREAADAIESLRAAAKQAEKDAREEAKDAYYEGRSAERELDECR